MCYPRKASMTDLTYKTQEPWHWLETQFMMLGAQRPYNAHHCTDKTCSGYCHHLSQMPPMNISDLTLPRNSQILMYGHSYLRQVFDNFLLANKDDIAKIEDLTFTGIDRNRKGDRNGCATPCPESERIVRQERRRVGRYPSLEILRREMQIQTYRTLNTTVHVVVNNGILQNPHCLSQLDRFLTLLGVWFDVMVVMQPHGDDFNKYMAMKSAGNDTGDWKPVDLNSLTSSGKQSTMAELMPVFKRHGELLIHTIGWTGTRERPNIQAGDVRADVTMDLGDYVYSRLGAETPRDSCLDGKDKSPTAQSTQVVDRLGFIVGTPTGNHSSFLLASPPSCTPPVSVMTLTNSLLNCQVRSLVDSREHCKLPESTAKECVLLSRLPSENVCPTLLALRAQPSAVPLWCS